jgi:alkylation response protein AidB-like acyl-CoA dehydrogenase
MAVVMSRPLFADEHDQFRRVAHRFVANEIVPNFEKWESEGIIDRALFVKAGELGLLGMAVPEDLGGGGVDDFRYNVIVNEEIHLAGCNGVGLGVALHNDIDGCPASARASSSRPSP